MKEISLYKLNMKRHSASLTWDTDLENCCITISNKAKLITTHHETVKREREKKKKKKEKKREDKLTFRNIYEQTSDNNHKQSDITCSKDSKHKR